MHPTVQNINEINKMLIYDFIDKVQHCRIKKNVEIKNIERVKPILRF